MNTNQIKINIFFGMLMFFSRLLLYHIAHKQGQTNNNQFIDSQTPKWFCKSIPETQAEIYKLHIILNLFI